MKTSLSFHGTHGEIIEWVSEWRAAFNLEAVAEFFFPDYRVVPLDEWENAVPNRISLHVYPVDLAARASLDFVRRNPHGFSIVVGRETSEGIRESLLGATTDNHDAMTVWRKLRKNARKSLKSGAWRISSGNGSRVRDDSHLYTAGARRLQDQGVPSLGPSDWIVFELD